MSFPCHFFLIFAGIKPVFKEFLSFFNLLKYFKKNNDKKKMRRFIFRKKSGEF
jgi:hypothetical protein